MELADFASQVADFDKASPRLQIRLFAWFLHTHEGKDVFDSADVRSCFTTLHLDPPQVSKYLPRMVDYKDLLKQKSGYKLQRTVRLELDAKYGTHHSVVQVSKLLTDLPGKVPDVAEKNFLAEAIKCYRIEAYRACIVMTWNLAYSHLLHWILNDPKRLSDFNTAIGKRYPKRAGLAISSYDDFLEELKEFEVIEICNTAGIVGRSIIKILKEKLDRRNTAAHPASVVIVQSQADDVITDLVNNVVLALN
ncbi:hypothetical protein [Mesorhizobium kowhaii]|uniref:Uncharacterized protein n=1 Tax=Mesorhizobium kowhaii TaxID=1300272 RepID=A0A2W7C4Y9_9HYPH|nr:hypothetical protein [Mesorhizobium kowhaii]PZV36888.1 hypothetical protein B5V02_19495 [Mesorhizobium kowhaii]